MFWGSKKSKELYHEKYGREPKSYKEFVEANKLYNEAKKEGKIIEPRAHKITYVFSHSASTSTSTSERC